MAISKQRYLYKLGKRIVAIRREKGISQAELARLCFKDPQSIERLENGKINPSIYYLQEVADGLKIDLKELL